VTCKYHCLGGPLLQSRPEWPDLTLEVTIDRLCRGNFSLSFFIDRQCLTAPTYKKLKPLSVELEIMAAL